MGSTSNQDDVLLEWDDFSNGIVNGLREIRDQVSYLHLVNL